MTPLIFLLLSYWSATGQNLSYEIIRNDKIIGSLVVKKNVTSEKVVFTLRNSVEFKVLFTLSIQYDLEEAFINDVLVSGKGSNSLNGSIQKQTTIAKDNQGYALDLDGTPNRLEDKEIKYSVSRVYHEEPYESKPIFSEYFGRYLFIEKIADQKYVLKSPDGENVYSYKGGYCSEVKVTRDFATFYIRMDATTLAMLSKD